MEDKYLLKLERELLIRRNFNKEDFNKIVETYNWINKLLEDSKPRKDGKPSISHPVDVAINIIRMKRSPDTIIAGLLHDVIEDISLSKIKETYKGKYNHCTSIEEVLKDQFKEEVLELVQGVTKYYDKEEKIKDSQYFKKCTDFEKREINNTRLLIEAMVKNPEVAAIKIADRLANMRTQGAMKEEKRVEHAIETLAIYVPIAKMIGEKEIAKELEMISINLLKEQGIYSLTEKENNPLYERMKKNDEQIFKSTTTITPTNEKEELFYKNSITIKNLMYSKINTLDEMIPYSNLKEYFLDSFYKSNKKLEHISIINRKIFNKSYKIRTIRKHPQIPVVSHP